MRKVDLCSVLLNLSEIRKFSSVVYRDSLKHLAEFLTEFLMESLHRVFTASLVFPGIRIAM